MILDKESLYCIFAGYIEKSENTSIPFEKFMVSKGYTHFESDVCEFLDHEILTDLHDSFEFEGELLADFDGNILEVPIEAYDQTITGKYEAWLTIFICTTYFGLPLIGNTSYEPEIYYSETEKSSLFIAKRHVVDSDRK